MKKLLLLAALLPICMFVSARKAVVYTSTGDGALKLQRSTLKVSMQPAANSLLLDPTQRFQTMDGFGYAITYSACYNLMKMTPKDRHKLLVKTFSPTKGYGINYIRTSIGCSDFSSCEYTLCDEPGLEHFRFHSDELDYVIPVMQEILEINPDVKLMAAPWTCPKWMKIKSLRDPKPHDSWTAGHLNPDYYETYAQYFVRFVQKMKKDFNIPVYAVTPQNEPLNAGNCASLVMGWDEQAAFIRHLAPAFARAGLTTKIYTFDHNYNYDDLPEQNDYPVKVYENLPADLEGGNLVAGSAWHNYGGSTNELDDVRQQAPDREMIFTEASIGVWNQGRDLKKRLIDDMDWMTLPAINRGCRAMMVWNFMLDTNRGPNLDGGCQTCFGAIDIDPSNYKSYTLNSHYLVMAHLSCVVKAGATRIAASKNLPKGVMMSAFQNPDGTYAAVLSNRNPEEQHITLTTPDRGTVTVKLPTLSAVSVCL